MTDQTATAPAATTPFSLRIHFEGAFVFSVQTENNNSNFDTPVTGVQVYAPTCEHLHAATINNGSMYMLENYWHCIDPSCAPNQPPAAIQLGALRAALQTNTPILSSTRPVGTGWTLAVNLPLGPQGWTSVGPVPTIDPTTKQPCFGGRSASIIPAQVATKQVITYTNVTSVEFHGACFTPQFQPVGGYVDLYITSEMPNVIPTLPHQARAVASTASLLGIDLVFQYPLPKGGTTGEFSPNTVHTGGCSVGIVTMPGSTK